MSSSCCSMAKPRFEMVQERYRDRYSPQTGKALYATPEAHCKATGGSGKWIWVDLIIGSPQVVERQVDIVIGFIQVSSAQVSLVVSSAQVVEESDLEWTWFEGMPRQLKVWL
ncbi:hypothetical protein TNCV_3601451 [Trichonephila clavipes]|nr:hypothetical protein TNCV_3601451 [Trichonephila clavipes]